MLSCIRQDILFLRTPTDNLLNCGNKVVRNVTSESERPLKTHKSSNNLNEKV